MGSGSSQDCLHEVDNTDDRIQNLTQDITRGSSQTKQRTDSLDCLDCKICHLPYDEEDHRPRNALCGHPVCTTCIRELIIERVFQCPSCRQKYNVAVPDDLPINFGLIDVIRAFKNVRTTVIEEKTQNKSGVTNVEDCKVHHKLIDHRCLKCQRWICEDCLDSHSTFSGCSTISSSKAMDSMTEEHNRNIDMLLNIFEGDAKYISTKIQDHTDKKMEHLKKAEKHDEETKKLHKLLEQGNIQKKDLLESKSDLNKATSPYMLSDKIDVMTQRQQSLRSWSVKYLGTDSPLGIPKALKEEKDVFAERIIDNEKRYSKLSLHEEDICFHSFKAQSVADDSICVPFNRLQKMIPEDLSLIFLELSMEGVAKGRVLIRLDKDLPNIRENILLIATGQQGESLRDKQIYSCTEYDIQNYYKLPFHKIPITPNCSEITTAKRGDVIGYFGSGYLSYIYFYLATSPVTRDYGNYYCVIGSIANGLDVMQECFDKYKTSAGKVLVSDCGVVIEHE